MLPLNPRAWAVQQFGTVQLGDQRRTERAVRTAQALVRQPQASLPQQLHSNKALKATYRLLHEADVSHPALLQPHVEQTRAAARRERVVLLVQDTTHLDYSHHPTTTGLGPIGDGNGRGLLVQSVLAVVPTGRTVLGLAHQEVFLRQPAPHPRDNASQRQKRPRESQVWARSVAAIGPAPDEYTWVHVADRGADLFEFMAASRAQATHFLVRACRNRRIYDAAGQPHLLFHWLRQQSAQAVRALDIPAQRGQPARTAQLQLSFGRVEFRPPIYCAQQPTRSAWVLRLWEPAPPAGVTPLEWVLVTSVPTESVDEAWERAAWYTCRWLTEEYHQCLKTGCEIEQRQLGDGDALQRLLGLLAPLAVYLLQLRDLARRAPARLARAELPAELVQVVAHLAGVPVEHLTVGQFWRTVAQQGGYLGRRRDGPPGWKTLWRGWLHIQTLLEGMHLAAALSP